jgi:tetratricopeptide (TPR) repeat protein
MQPPDQWRQTTGTPPLTPEGQRVVEQIESGGTGDLEGVFSQLLTSEAENARPWIEELVRKYAGPEGDRLRRQLWQQYRESYGNDPEGAVGAGYSALKNEDWPTAVTEITEALDAGVNRPELFYYRGLAANNLGDHELAHSDAALTLRMNPEDGKAFALYKLTTGRVSKVYINPATGDLAKTPFAPGGDTRPSAVRGQAPPGTAPVRTVQEDPVRQSARLTEAAQRHLAVGGIDEAIRAARRAGELNGDNIQAFNLLATAYEKKGDHARAVAAADKALAIDENSVPTLNTRAWSQSGMQKYRAALEDSTQLLLLDPSNAFGLVNKGRALGGLGKRQGMIDALASAAFLDGRFKQLHQRALQLATDKDTELLFAGQFGGSTRKTGAAPVKKSKRRFAVVLVASISGGLLIALGLLHVFSPAMRERINTTLRGLGRTTGDTVSGYTIRRVIGTGGMGVVYEATDGKLGRSVAIKKLRGEIRNDPKERVRFINEAKTVGKLRHANIVQILSVIEDKEDLLLVFEYVQGQTLEELLKEKRALPWDQSVKVFHGVSKALEHAHQAGVVHRDLKPSNIIIDSTGMAKVMDFGIARVAADAMTRAQLTNTVAGTPPYMAPEAEEGEIRKESDLFSMGVLLYEMTTGQQPFTGSAGAMFNAKAAGRYRPPSEVLPTVPKELDGVIARALDPHPGKRYRTISEMWDAVSYI